MNVLALLFKCTDLPYLHISRKTETVFPPQNRWLVWKRDLVVELKAIRISTPISIAIVEDTSGGSSNMPLTLLESFLFP